MTFYKCHRSATRPGQAGIAAISLALLFLLFSGMLLASQYLREHAASARVNLERQQASLRWAQDAVNAFAAVHGRLPCPASSRNQAEDCATGAKGWLPVQTLNHFGTETPPQAQLDIRYGVYRGTGTGAADADLAIASETFVPTLPTQAPVSDYPGAGTSPIINGLDLCAKLRGLYSNSSNSSNRWALAPQLSGRQGLPERLHILHDGTPNGVLNVAYAMAVAAPGAGIVASGVNATPINLQFEKPDRPHDGQYSDLVKVADVHSLYRSIACATSMASLDLLAAAQSWTSDADTMKDDNHETAYTTLGLQAVLSIVDIVRIRSASTDLKAALELLTENQLKADEAVAGLPSTLVQFNEHLAGQLHATLGLAAALVELSIGSNMLIVDSLVFASFQIAWLAAQMEPIWHGANAVLQNADHKGISDE